MWGNWVLATISNFQITVSIPNQCRRPWVFQTDNFVRSNNFNLKYQRFTPSGWKDKGIRNFEFVAKIHFGKIQCLKSKKIVYCNVKGILSNLEGINYWYEKGIYLLIIQTLPEISEPNDVLLVWFYAFKQITI